MHNFSVVCEQSAFSTIVLFETSLSLLQMKRRKALLSEEELLVRDKVNKVVRELLKHVSRLCTCRQEQNRTHMTLIIQLATRVLQFSAVNFIWTTGGPGAFTSIYLYSNGNLCKLGKDYKNYKCATTSGTIYQSFHLPHSSFTPHLPLHTPITVFSLCHILWM